MWHNIQPAIVWQNALEKLTFKPSGDIRKFSLEFLLLAKLVAPSSSNLHMEFVGRFIAKLPPHIQTRIGLQHDMGTIPKVMAWYLAFVMPTQSVSNNA